MTECTRYDNYEWRRPRTGEIMPFRCNSWRCPDCAPIVYAHLRRQLQKWAEEKDLRRFFTLTFAPANITPEQLAKVADIPYIPAEIEPEDETDYILQCKLYECETLLQHCSRMKTAWKYFPYGTDEERERLRLYMGRYVNYVWNKFRTALKRKFGTFSYVLFREMHMKAGDDMRFHFHILVSRFIPVEYIIEHFPKYGGGSRVDVEYIQADDVRDVAGYVTKYLSKTTQTPPELWPRGMRRYTTSRDIHINMTPADFAVYEQWRENVEHTETEDTEPCIAGYTPEAIEATDWTPCEKCPYRRKCTWPRPYKWTMYKDGGPVNAPPPDYVQIHNEYERAIPQEKPQRVMAEYTYTSRGKTRTRYEMITRMLPTGHTPDIIPMTWDGETI